MTDGWVNQGARIGDGESAMEGESIGGRVPIGGVFCDGKKFQSCQEWCKWVVPNVRCVLNWVKASPSQVQNKNSLGLFAAGLGVATKTGR